MLAFKEAIREWEYPFSEKMLGYSTLTRRAKSSPNEVFVIIKRAESHSCYEMFDVGLMKYRGRWMVDSKKFQRALQAKIETSIQSN